MTRVPPDRPEERRGTSSLEEWQRDRAEAGRLTPGRTTRWRPRPVVCEEQEAREPDLCAEDDRP